MNENNRKLWEYFESLITLGELLQNKILWFLYIIKYNLLRN